MNTDPLASLNVLTPEMAAQVSLRASLLLKGDSGTGKTTFALSFPGPIVVAYFDRNQKTVVDATKLRGDIKIAYCLSWKDYADQFVPAVKNRRLDASTIVVDTGDRLQDLLIRETQGSRARLSTPDWGTILSGMSNTTDDLVSSTLAIPGKHPGYNVVMCYHLKTDTDEDGVVRGIGPRLRGDFRNIVEDFFDYVLITNTELRAEVVKQPDGRTVSVQRKRFFAYTVPPTNAHTAKAPSDWPPTINGYEDFSRLADIVKPEVPAVEETTNG